MTTFAESNESERAAEVALHRLCGRLLLREIDGEFLSFLKSDNGFAILAKEDPALAGLLAKDWQASDYEDAAVEYCRLFIVPGVSVPLASAYQAKGGRQSSGSDNGVSTLVPVVLEALTLSLPAELAVLPPDHLSVLLEIRAWLLQNEDFAGADEFTRICLSPWLGAFCNRLGNEAESPIYLATAQLLAALTAS